MSFVDDARQLIGRHAGRVPEMAARLARAGIAPGDLSDAEAFSRVPLLRKSALHDLQTAAPPWGGLLADGFRPEACFLSPGAIVEPLVPRMVERLAEMLQAAGFGAAHTVLNGFNYHYTPAGLLFHSALNRAGCSVLPAGPQDTTLQGEFALALGANAFVGIASHLKILFEQQPGLAIRLAMAGAEPHGEAIRTALSEHHGVRCIDMYGFAEGGVVAATCAEAGALHLHGDVLAEVLDPASGEGLADGSPGELVVSLDNPGFPLLRFATGDLVQIETGVCACRRSGVLRLLGRADQSARVKGMLLHPSQLRRFLAAAGASACRVEVSRLDGRDRVAVAVRPGEVGLDMARLDAAFRAACRLRADSVAIDAALAADSCAIEDLRQAAPRPNPHG
ncbi:MAG: phenylacetate--CoA ligase family protein [Caldimonas sp.]